MTQSPPVGSSPLCPLRAGDSPAEGRVNPGGPVRPLPLGGFVLFPAENPPFRDNAFAQRDEPAAGWGTLRSPHGDRGVRCPATTSPRLPSLQNSQKNPETRLFYLLRFIACWGRQRGSPGPGRGSRGWNLAAPESEQGALATAPRHPRAHVHLPWGGGFNSSFQPTHHPDPARETKDDTKPRVTSIFFH